MNIIYKGGYGMETIVKFKNRETTASYGKLPGELLIFANLDMVKDEIDLVYAAICFEIGRCYKKNLYNIIGVYVNLMLDIEDIYEEIDCKYKNVEEYIFQMPLHIIELNFVTKALKDYSDNLKIDNEEDNIKLYKLNLLVEKVLMLVKNNYTALSLLYTKYDKAKRLALVKDVWDKSYELTGEN